MNTAENPSTKKAHDAGVEPGARVHLRLGAVQRLSCHIRDVGGHQWQHAGRQEGDEAGGGCAGESEEDASIMAIHIRCG